MDDSVRSPPRAPSLFDLTAPSLVQDSAEWLIPWEEIELGRSIGSGSYGEVFRAQWKHTDVAVKRISHINESLTGVSLRSLCLQADVLGRVFIAPPCMKAVAQKAAISLQLEVT